MSIPSSVIHIGSLAFCECGALTSIIVEEGNTIYDSRDNCNGIIETATNTLIAGCRSVTIPNSVITITDNALQYCYGLTSIVIPNSVTAIGEYAFANCSNLKTASIGESVASIGNNAFSQCYSLESVSIGSSVATIGAHTFSNCMTLTRVTNRAVVPQVIDANVFYTVRLANCQLFVPKESIGLYEAADVWKDFVITTIIEPCDVNADGEITAADLAGVVDVIAGLSVNERADVNADGNVTAADLGLIVNALAGI